MDEELKEIIKQYYPEMDLIFGDEIKKHTSFKGIYFVTKNGRCGFGENGVMVTIPGTFFGEKKDFITFDYLENLLNELIRTGKENIQDFEDLKKFSEIQKNYIKLWYKNKIKKEKEEEEKRVKVKEEEEERVKHLNIKKEIILKELNKSCDGIIDVIRDQDDFKKLLNKNQKKIIEIDKNYIQQFVKLSNFIKNKSDNLQKVFTEFHELDVTKLRHEKTPQIDKNDHKLLKIVKLKDITGLSGKKCRDMIDSDEYLKYVGLLSFNDFEGILRNQIHTYNLILFHSITMITSLIKGDLIMFYEIYESFDKLDVFNSNHENTLLKKLTSIETNLSKLISSIHKLEMTVINEIGGLKYFLDDSFTRMEKNITTELKSIDSSMKFNNLLSVISNYQLYKINKQTKSFIE